MSNPRIDEIALLIDELNGECIERDDPTRYWLETGSTDPREIEIRKVLRSEKFDSGTIEEYIAGVLDTDFEGYESVDRENVLVDFQAFLADRQSS